MKSRFPIVFAAVIVCATALPSRAAVYVKAGALFNQPGDVHIDNATAFEASLRNNAGYAIGLGYKFARFRLEAELHRLRSATEANETSGTLIGGITRTTGAITETTGFANAYFDFPPLAGFSLYAGAGLGYARIALDSLGRTRDGFQTLQFSGRESVFGYQGMLGVQFQLFGQATLNAGHRIVHREDIPVRDVPLNARQKMKLGENQMFEVGLAIGF